MIYRDLQVIYRACETTLDGEVFDNDPPVVTFNNLGSSSFTQVGAFTWADTVVAGFPVTFQFNGVDQDTVNPSTPYCGGVSPCSQVLYLEASGAWYGNNYTSSTTGCPQPPCATLNPAPPFSGWVFLGTNFSWETSCDHLSYSSAGCSSSNTYTFLIKLKDNMCPAPGVRYGTFLITVLPGPQVGPELKCVSILPNGDHELEWIPPAPSDTGANFDLYYIYHNNTPGGPFTLIDSVLDYSTSSYVHVAPGGQSYYYMTVKGGCDYVSPESDTLTTIELSVQALGGGSVAQLDWNAPVNPLPNSAAWYYIYREYPPGTWELIDSTTSLTYLDTITICDDFISYQVGLYDSIANCISLSSVAGDQFGDITAPPVSGLDSASVDPASGLAVLGWPQSNTPDAVSYIVYILSPGGSWLPVDTINDILVTNYINLSSSAAFGSEQYAIAVLDSCDNRSPISPLHRTIFFEANIDLCLQEVALNWSSYNGFPVQEYRIVYTENGGSKMILTTLGAGDTSFVHTNLTADAQYCYYIQAVSAAGDIASSNGQCVLATIPLWPDYQYMPRVSVNNNFSWVDVELLIDEIAEVDYYRIEQAFDLIGPFMQVGLEPKPASGQLIYSTHVTTLYNQGPLYYRTVAVDSCGTDAFVSDTIHTIFLEVSSAGDLISQLDWNEYAGWPTGVRQYDIWRSVNGAGGTIIASVTPTGPGPYTYMDDLNQSLSPSEGGGSICYVIDASENPGNPYGIPERASYSNIACSVQEPRVFIPNSFTPNLDGLNDVFLPSLLFVQNLPYEMAIYDRWGKQLFYTRDTYEGWDGTYEGTQQEAGTYVYHIRFITIDGEEHEYRGNVILFR